MQKSQIDTENDKLNKFSQFYAFYAFSNFMHFKFLCIFSQNFDGVRELYR